MTTALQPEKSALVGWCSEPAELSLVGCCTQTSQKAPESKTRRAQNVDADTQLEWSSSIDVRRQWLSRMQSERTAAVAIRERRELAKGNLANRLAHKQAHMTASADSVQEQLPYNAATVGGKQLEMDPSVKLAEQAPLQTISKSGAADASYPAAADTAADVLRARKAADRLGLDSAVGLDDSEAVKKVSRNWKRVALKRRDKKSTGLMRGPEDGAAKTRHAKKAGKTALARLRQAEAKRNARKRESIKLSRWRLSIEKAWAQLVSHHEFEMGNHTDSSDVGALNSKMIPWEQYRIFHHVISGVLRPEFTEIEREITALTDWKHDIGRETDSMLGSFAQSTRAKDQEAMMSRPQFVAAIMELLTIWEEDNTDILRQKSERADSDADADADIVCQQLEHVIHEIGVKLNTQQRLDHVQPPTRRRDRQHFSRWADGMPMGGSSTPRKAKTHEQFTAAENFEQPGLVLAEEKNKQCQQERLWPCRLVRGPETDFFFHHRQSDRLFSLRGHDLAKFTAHSFTMGHVTPYDVLFCETNTLAEVKARGWAEELTHVHRRAKYGVLVSGFPLHCRAAKKSLRRLRPTAQRSDSPRLGQLRDATRPPSPRTDRLIEQEPSSPRTEAPAGRQAAEAEVNRCCQKDQSVRSPAGVDGLNAELKGLHNRVTPAADRLSWRVAESQGSGAWLTVAGPVVAVELHPLLMRAGLSETGPSALTSAAQKQWAGSVSTSTKLSWLVRRIKAVAIRAGLCTKFLDRRTTTVLTPAAATSGVLVTTATGRPSSAAPRIYNASIKGRIETTAGSSRRRPASAGPRIGDGDFSLHQIIIIVDENRRHVRPWSAQPPARRQVPCPRRPQSRVRRLRQAS